MNYVIFENPGVIDPRSIKTFGISVKETENPIGYFGTGLKYALAILTREKHKVEILSGTDIYKISSRKMSVRDKEFDQVMMNGEDLPFTTELGKNWRLWQAFREIYCNCLDEGGRIYVSDLLPVADPEKTYIIVSGREFESLYYSRNDIVLDIPASKALATGETNIYEKQTNFGYYRGIQVCEWGSPALLTYNVNAEIELTEDRTVKYIHTMKGKIPRAIASMKDKSIIRKVLTAERHFMEANLDFSGLDWWEECVSEEFIEVLGKEYHFNNDKLNKSARKYLVKRMNKSAAKHYEPTKLTIVENKQLERCRNICRTLFEDFDKYEIMVVSSLGQEIMAVADMDMRKIVLSRRSFEMGTKFLLSTLIEEYAHLKTGYYDLTRELQTWLFDTICGMVENHVINEPI